MAPLHGCVIIAQQWTHTNSNSTLTDFVIKEAENDCKPSQGPFSTPAIILKVFCCPVKTIKYNSCFRLYTNRLLPSSSPPIPKWDSTFSLCGKNKKTCPRVTMQSNSTPPPKQNIVFQATDLILADRGQHFHRKHLHYCISLMCHF